MIESCSKKRMVIAIACLIGLSVLVLIVENELAPNDTRPHTHTTPHPNVTQREFCWIVEKMEELEECQPCTDLEIKSGSPAVCTSASYRQKVKCMKTGEVFRKCDRVMWLEERHFWTFEAVVGVVGFVAGLATMARQKILDHRVVQRIQRQTLLLLTVVNVAWTRVPRHAPTLPTHLSPESCPPSFSNNHPLILVSVDGFRPDYLLRGRTPTIQALGEVGVRAPYVKASYPTITFPNHYTIVTGLYPPAHGIVANKFYDPVFGSEFRLGRPESFKLRWWGGEPVWRTVEKQGKRAATFFWPGSEVVGNHPSVWYKYNASIPFEKRVDQVLSWLDLPSHERPSFMTLYMHEPDTVGHTYGPNAPQVDKALAHVDSVVRRLVDGLVARNLLSCVNLVVMADHGMAEAGQHRVIRVDKYIPNIKNRARFWNGVFGRMTPYDGSRETKESMMEALSCKRPEMRVYEKSTLPVRWHIGRQRRVEDIVFDLDAGYQVARDHEYKADAGDHGYDNFFPSMNALFVAHGPEFLRNTEVEGFQNIELYNLMCHLLGVRPAPNNGTWGALHHLLANPPSSPGYRVQEGALPVAVVPAEEDLEHEKPASSCEGDLDENEELFEILQETQEEAQAIIPQHLPWGMPQMGKARDGSFLLVQPDFVSAYSGLVKMPLWTSFTLDQTNRGSNTNPTWRSDPRIKTDPSFSCQAYQSLAPFKIVPQPLFPPELASRVESGLVCQLITNTAPFSEFLTQRWQQLIRLIREWTYKYGTINVITGPVFDYDADTFADDLNVVSRGAQLVVPTHMFLVVTRCMRPVNHLSECPHTYLDALAFVYPQALVVSNCLTADRFAQEFSATVRDVEKITGLKFYPNLEFEDQVRLQIRVHSNIWGRETWLNRIQSDIFGLAQ